MRTAKCTCVDYIRNNVILKDPTGRKFEI
jgi:hypothetical protein